MPNNIYTQNRQYSETNKYLLLHLLLMLIFHYGQFTLFCKQIIYIALKGVILMTFRLKFVPLQRAPYKVACSLLKLVPRLFLKSEDKMVMLPMVES